MKKILYAGAEVMPFAATGGLGDVLGSLPAAIVKKCNGDADVRVVMPLYKKIKPEWRAQMKDEAVIYVDVVWRHQYCGIKSLVKDGVTFYFIDNEYYFGRDEIYGYYDDGERYAFFSKAILDLMGAVSFYPDIYNANDWQTAMSVVYLERVYKKYEAYRHIKSVFTIHNIEYQGKYGYSTLSDLFGIGEFDILDYDGCVNVMKGAIECAWRVSTVSPTYAKEILGEEKSHGLCYCLRRHEGKLCGILNGIDYDYYDPANDKEIARNFTPRSVGRKVENKNALQRALGLPERDVPMLAVISRLVPHKGLDLIKEILARVVRENDLQFVVIGTGEADYENFFRWLEGEYPDKCRALITYNRNLAKKLYAASDIFLMPSKSEPCGLSQMIASRYGSVPIVRETGGLCDSIKGYREDNGEIKGNGFTFANYRSEELYDRINDAIALFNDPEKRKAMTVKVMKTDFSWLSSAEKYLRMYEL